VGNHAIVTIADAGTADHNAAGYAQAALDLAEGRRLLLRAAVALKAEPHLPVGPTTRANATGVLQLGGNEASTTLADLIGRVADRIEGALALECPALRQRVLRQGVGRRMEEFRSRRG